MSRVSQRRYGTWHPTGASTRDGEFVIWFGPSSQAHMLRNIRDGGRGSPDFCEALHVLRAIEE